MNKSLKEELFKAYTTRNKNNKEQRYFDIIFSIVFSLCLILSIMAFSLIAANIEIGFIMLIFIILCFILAIGYALFRKKRIMKRLFLTPIGSENIVLKEITQGDELDWLYNSSALTIIMEDIIDENFYNILYNWLKGMNALYDDKLILYFVSMKLWNKYFDYRIKDDDKILCISMNDLNINNENIKQFSYEHTIFGRYLDDMVKKV